MSVEKTPEKLSISSQLEGLNKKTQLNLEKTKQLFELDEKHNLYIMSQYIKQKEEEKTEFSEDLKDILDTNLVV